MSVAPIHLAPGSVGSPAAIAPADGVKDGAFSQLVSRFLQDVNGQQLAADQAIESFATGKTDNVHDVVLALAKADLEFRFLLEIRNRLIDTYQEVMRMQV